MVTVCNLPTILHEKWVRYRPFIWSTSVTVLVRSLLNWKLIISVARWSPHHTVLLNWVTKLQHQWCLEATFLSSSSFTYISSIRNHNMNPKTFPNIDFINTNKKSESMMMVKGWKFITTLKYWNKMTWIERHCPSKIF